MNNTTTRTRFTGWHRFDNMPGARWKAVCDADTEGAEAGGGDPAAASWSRTWSSERYLKASCFGKGESDGY
jgi:hypothetical protein